MLEVWIGVCSRAHAIIKRVAFACYGRTTRPADVWNKSAMPQTALILVLRRRRASAVLETIVSIKRALLAAHNAIIVRFTGYAKEVLDFLAGAVVAIVLAARAAKDSLAAGRRIRSRGRHYAIRILELRASSSHSPLPRVACRRGGSYRAVRCNW